MTVPAHAVARAPRRRRLRRMLTFTSALGCVGLLAACGSSSGAKTKAASAGGSTAATIAVGKVNGYGSVLVTGSDQPVYILSTDPSGSSKCAGACAKTWMPVTVKGTPSAGSGVSSGMLSSFKRADGTTQVLYDKHALYTHSGSASSAAGSASDGGVWYLIDAKGKAVKSTTSGGY